MQGGSCLAIKGREAAFMFTQRFLVQPDTSPIISGAEMEKELHMQNKPLRAPSASLLWWIACSSSLISNHFQDLSFRVDGGDECFYVAKRVRKGLRTIRISGDLRNMIRHHHSIVANFFIDPHRPQHVDIAIVDEPFLEIQKAAADITEVDVEDLAARAEVTDHVEDFFARFP